MMDSAEKSEKLGKLKFTKEQFNYTIALAVMKKYYREGKISRQSYERMVEKYEPRTLAKEYSRC